MNGEYRYRFLGIEGLDCTRKSVLKFTDVQNKDVRRFLKNNYYMHLFSLSFTLYLYTHSYYIPLYPICILYGFLLFLCTEGGP